MVSQFGSLGYTIMGKTADLAVVQKTIISYVYMDTFCFHPNEFILIVKSERSVYMNAK